MGNAILAFMLLLIIGGLFGAFLALLFYRIEKSWYRFIESLFGLGGGSMILKTFYNFFDIYDKFEKLLSGIGLYLGIGVGFFVITLVIRDSLKKQNGEKVKLRMLDLLLGYDRILESYYNDRRKNAVKEFTKKEKILESKKKEIDSRQKDVADKEKILKDKEIAISKNLDKIEELIKLETEYICVSVSSNKKMPINSYFLKTSKDYIKDFYLFKRQISVDTNKCVDSLKKKYNNDDDDDMKSILTAYITSVCSSIVTFLFDNSPKVRVHFRKLIGDEYVRWVIVKYNKENGNLQTNYRSLNPIPIDTVNMIEESYRCKEPLIRSLNNEFHYKSKNSTDTYEDYLTCSFSSFSKNNHPLLCFNISVADAQILRTKLYVICFFRLDVVLKEELKKIDNLIALEKLI